MKLHQIEIPVGVTKRGRRKQVNVTSVNVSLSTSEIKSLIQELEDLKREGLRKTGYHIHLSDLGEKNSDKIEVTLYHEKTYCPQESTEIIVLDDTTKRNKLRGRRRKQSIPIHQENSGV
jgi:hypothetical protein